jgi:hypothetical protein
VRNEYQLNWIQDYINGWFTMQRRVELAFPLLYASPSRNSVPTVSHPLPKTGGTNGKRKTDR